MGEGELQENSEKDALFWEGTEKWQKNMNIAVLFQGLLSRIVVTKIEVTCNNINVIEDAVHRPEDYESDHDLWLLNMKAFISTESV